SSLTIISQDHSLKAITLTLHSIIPYAVEVEHLFLSLSDVQGHQKVRLTVENFEKLGKLHLSYAYEL
ncbi:hypothetical protein C8Q75DRAFT_719364, partial [Abortiporus biennis]